MEDMSELMNKVNDMLKNDNIPDELKNIVKNMSNSDTSNSSRRKHIF